jgi:hypothetical protein
LRANALFLLREVEVLNLLLKHSRRLFTRL